LNVSQIGNAAIGGIFQSGDDNVSNVPQSGFATNATNLAFFATVGVTRTGDRNTVDVVQNGTFIGGNLSVENAFRVVQSGDDNIATID